MAATAEPSVIEGLGWPGYGAAPAALLLGWPDLEVRPEIPQVGRQTRAASQGDVVSRETLEASAAARSTPAPLPATTEETTVTQPTQESTDLARFGPHPAPGTRHRTAGDIAASTVEVARDDSTPMAQSVEHQLLAAQRIRTRDAFPKPDRTRVMVVANQKGGVGKTTTTVNVAAALAQHGLRVLVVDLDPQGNASTALNIDHGRGTPSAYDVLVDGMPLSEVVQPSPEIDGLLVVPATIDLAGAEIELVSLVAREGRLRRAVHAYTPVLGDGEDRLDYVLIDCPPSLGLLTLNAMVAAEELLIPIQAEYYALEGLGQLVNTVEMVKAHLNPDLAVSTILLTMYDARTRLAAGVADEVRSHFGPQVLRTAIPRSVRISEAPSYGQTVMTYDPGSPGALSYLEAAREMAIKGANA